MVTFFEGRGKVNMFQKKIFMKFSKPMKKKLGEHVTQLYNETHTELSNVKTMWGNPALYVTRTSKKNISLRKFGGEKSTWKTNEQIHLVILMSGTPDYVGRHHLLIRWWGLSDFQ